MSGGETDQLLENGSDEKNELGLMEVDEVLEPDSPDFKMSDRNIEDIENSLKKNLIDRYSEVQDKEVLNGYQSVGLVLGSQAVQFSISDLSNPIKWIAIASGAFSGMVLGWNIASDDFSEGLFEVGDVLPDAEKYVEVEDLDRDYKVVEASLDQLIAKSDKVEINQENYDPEEVSQWYGDLLEDYDGNEMGENNNLQLLAITENEDLWEYRIELKSSGSPVESIRGLSDRHPEFYIDNTDAAEIDYKDIEKALA